MPTEAHESILYRDLTKVQAKPIIELAAPLLQEIVNFATHALVRCALEPAFKKDEDIAVVALYRHIIEMVDGVEVLISQGCAIPALPLLRSSFESLLYIEYILEVENEYARRSLAWLVGYTHQRIAMYERLDPSTTKGQAFQRYCRDDIIASRVVLPPEADAQPAIANLQTFLAQAHIQPIETEFSSFRRTPRWYSLFGGPSDLAALAQHLNRRATYDFLYRSWSRTAHGQDLLPFIDRTPEGEPAIGKIRDPKELREVASFAAAFLLEATRRTVGKFRPGETFKHWYRREVQERYLQVSRVPAN